MNMSVTYRLVLTAAIAAITVLISGVPQVLAQKRIFRQTQYQGTAPVELPSPSSEASMFPTMGDVVPPSLQQQQPARMMDIDAPDGELYGGAEYPGGTMLQDGQPMMQLQPPLVDDLSGEPLEPQSYFGCDGPAPIYSTGTWWWRGNWYTRLDVWCWTAVMCRDKPSPEIAVPRGITPLTRTTSLLN